MTPAALVEMARIYRSAVAELLMREYRWTGGAAERFMLELDRETAQAAHRAQAVRRELSTRREMSFHESQTTGPQAENESGR